VSLVLRGAAEGKISEPTQRHVRAVADELGYRPSRSARGLRSGRSQLLGLVIPNVADPFFGEVLRGAQRAAAELGYTVAMIEALRPPDIDEAIGATRSALMDGLVLHSPTRGDLARAKAVADRLVVVDGGAARGVARIRYDIADAVRQVVEHLDALGHTRVAHVHGDVEKPTFAERRRAMDDLLGRRLRARMQVPFAFDDGAEELTRALAAGRRLGGATAIVCDTDSLAAMAFAAARANGLRVPEDVSVVGFDDTDLGRVLGLTSVRLPGVDAGDAGVRMLLERLDGGASPSLTLPVTLVARSSTART
jgi:DNA-binding LacI/PurR family transcriptional regulator